MANYATLKAAVANVVKTNGAQEITGANLQSVLLSMINSLGADYQFAGVATTNTVPTNGDERVFYIATEAGAYTNFGSGLVLKPNRLGVLVYDGTWSLHTTSMMGDMYGDAIAVSTAFIEGSSVLMDGTIGTGDTYSHFKRTEPFKLGKNDALIVRCAMGTSGCVVAVTDSAGVTITPMVAGLDVDRVLTYRYRPSKDCYVIVSGRKDAVFSFFKVNNYPVNDALYVLNKDMIIGDSSVTFPSGSRTYIKRKGKNVATIKYQQDTTYTFNGTGHLVLHENNEMEVIDIANDITRFDTLLLDMYEGTYYGGLLFPLYLQRQMDIPSASLSGKVLSILGDSISTFGVPDQNNATGTWTYPGNRCRYPQSNLFTNVNNCYWKRLLDKFNMKLGINESWAGSRVSNNQPTDRGDFGPNRCISSQTWIGHLGNNGTPDIILVYAGTNDAGGGVELGTFNTENPINYTDAQIAALPVVTFADAYRAMLIRLLKTYPTARIIVVLPNLTTSYYTITDLDDYIEVIKEECDFFGIKYIDTRTAGITLYNQGTYFPDGTHPNAAGMELIYKLLCREVFDELNKYGL